jgi:hypothetical protein
MAQDYTIDWVGTQTNEWSGQHGPMIDYTVALAGEEGTVKLTQKPDTAVPVVGQQLYGYIETKHFTKHDGESFEVRKFTKEQRPDGHRAPSSAAPASNGQSPEFWAAKDARIGRQGFMQAVVNSGVSNELLPQDGGLGLYIKAIEKLTDALTESLDKATPSPNQTSPATLGPSSGGSAGSNGADAPEPAGEREAASIPAAPAPDLTDLKLALVACGHKGEDPAKTFAGLDPDEKGRVKLILNNLKSVNETEVPDRHVTEPMTSAVADDDEVPF